MATATITMQVDTDLAQAYRSAPAKDQSKLRLLLNLWLRDLFVRSTSLTVLMDELSDKAEAQGLTATKLEDMLRVHERRFVQSGRRGLSSPLSKLPPWTGTLVPFEQTTALDGDSRPL